MYQVKIFTGLCSLPKNNNSWDRKYRLFWGFARYGRSKMASSIACFAGLTPDKNWLNGDWRKPSTTQENPHGSHMACSGLLNWSLCVSDRPNKDRRDNC